MDDGAFGALSLAEFVADARVLVPSRRSRPDRILVPSRVDRSNASTASEETNPRIVLVFVVDDTPLPTVVVVSARVVERIVRLERIVRARNGLARIPIPRATRISSRARRDERVLAPLARSLARPSRRATTCAETNERTNEREGASFIHDRHVDLRARDARDARASVDDETRDVVTRVVSRASGELERGGAGARVRV